MAQAKAGVITLPMGRVQAEMIRLSAQGFEPRLGPGNKLESQGKTGGLTRQPTTGEVEIPAGAVIFRLYGWPGDFGSWWFTPFELLRILNHFGRGIDVILEGRTEGKSGFHAAFALMREWYDVPNDPDRKANQIAWFHAVKPIEPMTAWYGVGDEAYWLGAIDKNGTMTKPPRTQKPLDLRDAIGTPARQLYLPNVQHYRRYFTPLPDSGSKTEKIAEAVQKYRRQRLSFE